jgi:hypothetical protein
MEGLEFDIAESYVFITRTLFISTWYAPVAPVGLLFGIIGMVINYWVDKYFLVKNH